MQRVLFGRQRDPQRTQNSFFAGFFMAASKLTRWCENIDLEGKGNKGKGGRQWEIKARRIRTRVGNKR